MDLRGGGPAHEFAERGLLDEDYGRVLALIALSRTAKNGKDFDKAQRAFMLMTNARYVRGRWPDHFTLDPPHYMCEVCEFVSPVATLFQIDHVLAKSLEGENQLLPSCAELGISDQLPSSPEEIDKVVQRLFAVGSNAMVLCGGCNNAGKSDRSHADPSAGYAGKKDKDDHNPDHL